jgi:hypothetical protein
MQIIDLDLNTLSSDDLKKYQSLVPEQYKECLLGKDPYGIESAKVYASAVVSNGELLGLVMGSYCKGLPDVEIYLFKMVENDLEAGKNLLKAFQERLKQEGASIFALCFSKKSQDGPFCEAVVQGLQWKGIRPFMLICEYEMKTLSIPWIHKKNRYPSGYGQFFWRDLTPNQREQVATQESQKHFSPILSPLTSYKHPIEMVNSLGLKKGDEVIGWMINHRVDQDTIRYGRLYVNPNEKFHNLAIALISNSILLHLKSGIKRAKFEIPLLQVRRSWINFVQHHLMPYADRVELLYQAFDY